MYTIRRGEERGHADHGWLDTHHTFSFADYHDPAHMGFRALRVINEDVVQPGRGFGAHPHRDMEIVTWVLDGALQHRDSLGHGTVIQPGEVQRMTAGTGVVHSEMNASRDAPVHLLQIWILPERAGLAPSYEQKPIALDTRRNELVLAASRDGRDGSVTVHQDVELRIARLDAGRSVSRAVAPGRGAWIQVARGEVLLGDAKLRAGDGVALEGPDRVEIRGTAEAEVLLFDLA